MTMMTRALAGVSFTALVLLAGCRRHAASELAAETLPAAPAAMATATERDTVRGVVRVVGSLPNPEVIVSPGPGQPPVAIAGTQRDVLARLAGLDVVVRGHFTAEKSMRAGPSGARVLDAARFEVRSANGVPAIDGVVEQQQGQYFLRLANGERVAVRNLPATLRAIPGSRVFIAGALDQAPASYGIVTRAP